MLCLYVVVLVFRTTKKRNCFAVLIGNDTDVPLERCLPNTFGAAHPFATVRVSIYRVFYAGVPKRYFAQGLIVYPYILGCFSR